VLERFGLPEPELLESGVGRQLILVDHNEVAQAVEGVRQADILEVWEHHRIGDLHLARPIVFHCEPVGATATLIAEQFRVNEIAIPPDVAGALLAGILSDTLVLVSPTTVRKDRQMAERLARLAGVEVPAFGAELLAARGDLSGISVAALVDSDLKEFGFGGERVVIAQVESVDPGPVFERHAALRAELDQRVGNAGPALIVFMATDVTRRGSHVWCAGPRSDRLERALGRPVPPDGAWIDGLMSRKKQLVPALEQAFAAGPPAREVPR
jgi:manganese-dependent inorganic pyrophosphatase